MSPEVQTWPAADSGAWPECPFEVAPVAVDALGAPLPDDSLCSLEFGAGGVDDDPRRVRVPLPVLPGSTDAGERWRSPLAVTHGRERGLSWACNGVVAFMHRLVPEAALDAGFEDAVGAAYAELMECAKALGYPHLLRVWNYLSAINEGVGDAERYRRFCVGRFPVLATTPAFEQQLPAASAIGTPTGSGLLLCALAARGRGIQIENPRQTSAFRYPRRYGRRSPSFSRATLVPWARRQTLFVSGTASIVGHVSLHPDDPVAQLRQIAENLEALQEEVRGPHSDRSCLLESFTLYVRRPPDLPALLPLLPELFGPIRPRVLGGDICRRDLLVEVEAVYRRACADGAAPG